eukprot:CAMPEP_0201592804 /NCGR_PEP_ID=MMETSP0190_2-20130828/190597_1 /ASSEMBLY_ACC=CAM_ASM_000263 /TAXON_ID=37353 /ORGANISM="Rosalina sp." /LENGTH=462 /DNA_ID=CAMNT_0048051737 /DNA_START=77 /DNA_END=1465 /DNA_ORIENTATION=+
MINISKFVAIGSLLLYGANANYKGSDWDQYELGLELEEFYQEQNEVALCKYDCMYGQDDYLMFFHDECNICVPKSFNELDDIVCNNKEDYATALDGFYKEMKEIIKWDHEIKDIEESEYQNGYEVEKVYHVTVKLDTEYIYGLCAYKTCTTEEFEILNGKIMSYKVVKVHLKEELCEETKWPTPGYGYDTTTKAPTTWKKSTTQEPSAPFVPPSKTPSWSPTTPSPTTAEPTTAEPTPKPTTPEPTLKPTPYPTTAWPTKKPTTPEPTPKPTPYPTNPTTAWPTKKPTTPEPTPKPTPYPTTAWPTKKPTTPEPTPKPTAYPTTEEPTNSPTTPEPTPRPTPYPTTAWPTKKPTTPEPTPRPTPNPTTAEPTPKPTTTTSTAEPTIPIPPKTTSPPSMWKKTTSAPKKCNYNGGQVSYGGYETGYENQQCEYGYKCVKEDDYSECGYGTYCPGICIKEKEEY